MTAAEVIFWGAVALVGYTYAGYPAIAWGLARLRPRRVRMRPVVPTMTILIAAHNEEAGIGAKIDNCLELDYPPDRLDLIVVSDGSTDRTAAIAGEYAFRYPDRVRLILLPERRGKPSALNAGAADASGEILLLADVRQYFEKGVARALARHFADPDVGAVSGELLLLADGQGGQGTGLGAYWRYEKWLRQAESRWGSSMGYTGAVSAVRRCLFERLPPDTLLDDLVVPLRVISRRWRVVFEPEARAFDHVSQIPGREFSRKVRTLAGVLQTCLESHRLVGPLGVLTWWQLISHKLLRLVVPYALITILFLSFALEGALYRNLLLAQILAYACGAAGLLFSRHLPRITTIPGAFLMLNGAAIVAAFRYVLGGRLDLWQLPTSGVQGVAAAVSETPTKDSGPRHVR